MKTSQETSSIKILITNDDGVDSPGLHCLARAVEGAGFETLVVAPDHDASGTGTAVGGVSSFASIGYESRNIKGFQGAVYALAASPAFCVMIGGRGAFGEQPDIVLSGINSGSNMGRSALHSGTVGAALTAQNFGMKGMAVSAGRSDPWHWETAAELALKVLPRLIAAPERCVLNLNAPGCPAEQVKGLRWTRLAPFSSLTSSISSTAEQRLKVELTRGRREPADDTDLATIRRGFASLSSIQGITEVWNSSLGPGDDFGADDTVPASAGEDGVCAAPGNVLPL